MEQAAPKVITEEVPDLPALDPSTSRSPIEHRREYIAALLAIGVFLIFFALVLSPVIYWFRYEGGPPEQMLVYVKDATGIVAALLGAMVGFYFSQKRLDQ
ncbi:MAG: hypothetical protein HYU37_14845 [Acidobacteria bacterium]|nr:hypothetical protein [Acidobacteriota bacterium]